MSSALVKLIKQISTNRFEVALVELPTGYYQVIYGDLEKAECSERIQDYHTASYLFDLKAEEMTGQ